MKYQLVLQWSASSIGEYDSMIALENELIEHLASGAEVDGHDMGSGEINLFLHTQSPSRTFERIRGLLSDRPMWKTLKAAYREINSERFVVLWPVGLDKFEIA